MERRETQLSRFFFYSKDIRISYAYKRTIDKKKLFKFTVIKLDNEYLICVFVTYEASFVRVSYERTNG